MKLKTSLLAMLIAGFFSANAAADNGSINSQPAKPPMKAKAEPVRYPVPKNLDFSQVQGEKRQFEINGNAVPYRAFEHIVYVLKPSDTRYQTMNIYIPEAYFNGGTIDGYNADTAPIFFPNDVGGYMPATAGKPELGTRGGDSPNAIMVALSKGYVVASVGARGRTESDGKAPAAIIDLKAAVRYLKANDKLMAGDANKIISNGTSAGGALSALLGTSGNAPQYEPYLKAAGAAAATDDIFAVSVYCPITNLEHADMAYEWQFNGVNDYKKIDMHNIDYRVERKLINGTQTAAQIALSDQLKPLFPAYVNGLNFKDKQGQPLTLDEKGNGSFKQFIEAKLMESAQKALDNGTDLSDQTWLTIENGNVTAADFDSYAKFVGRQKTAPAFDAVDLSSGENQLFGDTHTDKKHFTDFAMQHSTAANAKRVDNAIVGLMNAMNYQSPTQHYRIRVGENDRDTSLAISALLALKLQNEGKAVDYALPWGVPHSGDYDLDELFDWVKSVVKGE
ncbi:hypothetical protein EDC44_13228 [Cricetibacter osteomyelitidis]|uniref:BD-FAE-like domain-containing protein n=2 Tax=Cricetibacter osteomyelitidis TaxID=1521931 RepID=A0A4R2T2S2_9PAST|nr:subtype B tannase [Cricetibacter osteomyelitidis]TCP91288.1 hypothetical protein EDC44_13228 [Cricetibacter osteomyelitidis]